MIALILQSFVIALAALLAAPVIAQPSNLFHDAYGLARAADMAAPNAGLQRILQRRTVKEARLVEIDALLLAAEAGASVNFNVFPGRDIPVTVRSIDRRGPGDLTLHGSIGAPSGGTVTIVVENGKVSGSIRPGSEIYMIESVGSGLHAVVQLEPRQFPPDHPAQQDHDGIAPPDRSERSPEPAEAGAPSAGSAALPACATCIDVIVAYTPAAKSKHNDMDGLILLAVEEANKSYVDSGVNLQLRLVHKYQTAHKESSWNNDLKRFRVAGDGYMDEIHTLRTQYNADVAVLILDNWSACGLSSAILADKKTAFAAVHWDCATGYFSFAHEIGHLQGARHNAESDSTTRPFAYGHGYIYPPGRWRTIMAYDSSSCGTEGCTRVQCWSTPGRKYPCADNPTVAPAMGTPDKSDNVRVLNETRGTVSGFMP